MWPKKFDRGHSTLIIAEAGVNHNGSLKLAKKLIDAAALSEADFVKFQTFRSESVICKNTPKAEYQKHTSDASESQLEMVKKFELNRAQHLELIKYSTHKKINILFTPFDLESIDLLNSFGVELIKTPSGEINNLPYLRKIAKLKKHVILSTGMSTLNEISTAIKIMTNHGTPLNKLTILHCNSEYPTPYKDVNLKVLETLKSKFPKIKIGYSDHTLGIEVPVAAVALGAEVIEKHFTLDKSMEGPDHQASLNPNELTNMVRTIRNIEKSLGNSD